MKECLEKRQIEDVSFHNVLVTESEQFQEIQEMREEEGMEQIKLPLFWWMKVPVFRDGLEISVSDKGNLVLSEKVLSSVKENFNLTNCFSSEFTNKNA